MLSGMIRIMKEADFSFRDAFAHSQTVSKMWLCEEVERLFLGGDPLTIWILGGWVGLQAYLLFCRDRLPIERVRSFDIDPLATQQANWINNCWELQEWKFRAFTADVQRLSYTSGEFGAPPHLVINSVVEHLSGSHWFDAIPAGTWVALQSTDMPHAQHCRTHASLEEFRSCFPLSHVAYSGSKEFKYPDKSFSRWMVIGRK